MAAVPLGRRLSVRKVALSPSTKPKWSDEVRAARRRMPAFPASPCWKDSSMWFRSSLAVPQDDQVLRDYVETMDKSGKGTWKAVAVQLDRCVASRWPGFPNSRLDL